MLAAKRDLTILSARPQKLGICVTIARRIGPILAAAIIAGSVAPAVMSAQTAPRPDVSAVSVEEANRRGREAFGRKDYASALNWFRKSADQGDAEAQASLGMMYYDGLGVAQDFAQAFSWYLKAATQGHTTAQDVVGHMYLLGKGVTKDYALALTWLRKAADKGAKNAQMALFSMYSAGEGVPQDWETAKMWMDKALGDKGNPRQTVSMKPDITLWCDMPLFNGRTAKALTSIDTKSKHVKMEGGSHGTFEYRDGYYGKVDTAGYLAAQAIKVQQFVTIDDSQIRFGYKNEGVVQENTIDRNTGIFRSPGRITQCTEAKARP
jgi:Sel1 repeat